MKKADSRQSDLPFIGQPARQALELIGVQKLKQLTRLTEAQLLALHGVGPKAIRILRAALDERGLAFAAEESVSTLFSQSRNLEGEE